MYMHAYPECVLHLLGKQIALIHVLFGKSWHDIDIILSDVHKMDMLIESMRELIDAIFPNVMLLPL